MKGKKTLISCRYEIPSEDEVLAVEVLIRTLPNSTPKPQPEPVTTVPEETPMKKIKINSPSTPHDFITISTADHPHHSQKKQSFDGEGQHARMKMVNEDEEIKEADKNELGTDNNNVNAPQIEADDDRETNAKEARRRRKHIIRLKAQGHKI